MHDTKLIVIGDVIYCFPHISLNIKCFNFLHKIKGQLVADSRFWLQTLTANNKNIFVIEVANAEGLSWMLKVRQHNPFLARNGEELSRVQTLNIRPSTRLIITIRHTSEYVNNVFVIVHYVVSPCVKHVIQWLQLRPILIQQVRLTQKVLSQRIVSTHHK